MKNEKKKFQNEMKVRLYSLVVSAIKYLPTLPKNRVNDNLMDQASRSVTSVIANFVEAQSTSSTKTFLVFIEYALRSCNESKVWICLIRDVNSLHGDDKIAGYLKELDEISRILAKIIFSTKNRN